MQQQSEDALNEELARFGLTDGRVKEPPTPHALRSIVELCEKDQDRLLGDPLLQSIRTIALRALAADDEAPTS